MNAKQQIPISDIIGKYNKTIDLFETNYWQLQHGFNLPSQVVYYLHLHRINYNNMQTT